MKSKQLYYNRMLAYLGIKSTSKFRGKKYNKPGRALVEMAKYNKSYLDDSFDFFDESYIVIIYFFRREFIINLFKKRI
jgi:hypothetical protein